jgi:hypothetical protein
MPPVRRSSIRHTSAGTGVSLGANRNAVLTIFDNDAAGPVLNPVDASAFFVRQHYHDFLNREADAPGLAFWTKRSSSAAQTHSAAR